MHRLPNSALIQELIRLKVIPEGLMQHVDLLHLMLPVLRADFTVVETYAYVVDVPFDNPISVFGGIQDYSVGRDALFGWGEQTVGSFDAHMLTGDHFFLETAEVQLLQIMKQKLTN